MLGNGANLTDRSWCETDALLAAASCPEMVRSLVLMEPALDQLLQNHPKCSDDP